MCVAWPQSCPILCDSTDCSPLGSSVRGILQAGILEWVAISFSQGIFPTLGSNPHLLCLLHQQAGSLPLAPPGKPPFPSGWSSILTIQVTCSKVFTFIYTFGCARSQLRHVGSSPLTRDQTLPPALGAWSFSHQTTREIFTLYF